MGDPTPAPGSEEKLDRLKALLREMFQLDRGDLDFGLYRIMNMKSAEVVAFLDNDLLPQVKETLRFTTGEDRAELEERIRAAEKSVRALRVDPGDSPEIRDLRARLAEMKKDADAEADVYNHLANFFARYYTDGDIQHVLFLDPKGLGRFGPRERRKVALHREIATTERRARENDPKLRLHAYVLSVTPPDGIGDEPRSRSQ